MRKQRNYSQSTLILMCGVALLLSSTGASAQSSDLVRRAMDEYTQGHYDKAAELLQQDLQKNPDSGLAHQVLGKTLEKQGFDKAALHEFEAAFRLIPSGVVQGAAQSAVSQFKGESAISKTGSPSGSSASAQSVEKRRVASGNWFEDTWNNTVDSARSLFAPKTTTTTSSSAAGNGVANSSSLPEAPSWFSFPMPDIGKNFKHLYKDARRQVAAMIQKKDGTTAPGGYKAYKTISMVDLQDIIDKCRDMPEQKFSSHPDRVVAYPGTPGNSREWDYWISRYRRAFQFLLLHHLDQYSKDETRGATSIAFSVDKFGKLRGSIYATTSNDNLNNCLLQTIRDLNGSRVLKFPDEDKIEGWNFTMSWDFRKMLAIVRARRAWNEQQTALNLQAKNRTAEERKIIDAKLLAEKKIAEKKLAEEKAKAEKLKLAAKQKPELIRKAQVSALVIQKPKPVEMKAVALRLSDVLMSKQLSRELKTEKGDVFKGIDDRQIMSWPDVSN